MNTGIQDAWNLGWKLAMVSRGVARDGLLDSYEAERWAVGRFLLRYTDRIFGTFTRAMASGRVSAFAREVVVPRVLPRVLGSRWLRSKAFRFVSELGIQYRRSPAVAEGEPRLHAGPRPGDRLPDARLTIAGRPTSLHREVIRPHLTLLMCERSPLSLAYQFNALVGLLQRFPVIDVVHLSARAAAGALVDDQGELLEQLGVRDAAQYLVRPDGYVAFRCAGRDLGALSAYLGRWFP